MGQPGNLDIERETWGSKFDFLLSCIGYAVGLGNLWRFPYLCYRNGGGAFLVPYLIMLVICGLPLFFFEMAIGQFASEGPVTVWKVNPMFYGIGWGMVIINCMICMYYNVIIMYAIYYMFVSFVNLDGEVPWSDCDNPWNSPNCWSRSYPDFAGMTNMTQKVTEKIGMMDETCVNKTLKTLFNGAVGSAYSLNYSVLDTNFTDCMRKLVSPSEEYWTRFVLRLHEADGLDDVGNLSLKNTICLLFAWVLIFFCLMKGIKSSGKVVYFTATFPYVILIVLLVRGVTLPGYMEGIKFYIIPKWEELKNPKVWSDAATQIFYSLGPGFGGVLCLSSFNPFKKNCVANSFLVACINSGTSIFGGFVIFSLLGYMAHQTNQDVSEVADSGPGLAFVAYPEGIARLPVSSLWAFLFFFMILTLGLDSQFVMMETALSGMSDVWPRVLRKRKTLVTFIASVIGFLFGLPMCTKGGIYILTLFDWYSASYGLMLIAFCEVISVVYIYGVRNFILDIEMMVGKYPWVFWSYFLATWCFISPVAIIFIMVMSGVHYTAAYYGDYVFPKWAEGIGWIMVALPVIMVIIGMIHRLVVVKGNFREAIRPEPTWGPRLAVNRVGRYNDNLGFVPDEDIENEKKIFTMEKGITMENGTTVANGIDPPPSYGNGYRL